MLRKSFIKGLSSQPVSIGNFKVVEEAGPSVLYVRMALKDLYIKKEKRGLLSYTPVGMVAHGVADMASDAVDKTTLVEMKVEVEMQETANRREPVNTSAQAVAMKSKRDMPLFESPWVALFLLLRREWTTPRTTKQ